MYKVSVVIPIYDVEPYIVRCAESLFKQTLDNMQFIFVDDASQDNSITLLEQTLQRFPQRISQTLILHHSKNIGLPMARATGLFRVEAPYVAFCDSDDCVDDFMYESLYNKIIQNNSDMVVCGRKTHYKNGRVVTTFDNPNQNDSLIHNFLYRRLAPCVWNRLTRTDICLQVRFPTENFFEDGVLTAQLLSYSKQVTFLPEAPYHYFRRKESITGDMKSGVVEKKMRECMTNYNLMHSFIISHHQIEEKDFIFIKLVIYSQFLFHIKRWSTRNIYLNLFPELKFRVLFNHGFPLYCKAYHLLLLLGLYPVARPFLYMAKPFWMMSPKNSHVTSL